MARMTSASHEHECVNVMLQIHRKFSLNIGGQAFTVDLTHDAGVVHEGRTDGPTITMSKAEFLKPTAWIMSQSSSTSRNSSQWMEATQRPPCLSLQQQSSHSGI